jgi:hypothetical protein
MNGVFFTSEKTLFPLWNYTVRVFVSSDIYEIMAKMFFSHPCSVEEHILGQESQRTLPKSRRDVNLLYSFLRTNDKDKKIEFRPWNITETSVDLLIIICI